MDAYCWNIIVWLQSSDWKRRALPGLDSECETVATLRSLARSTHGTSDQSELTSDSQTKRVSMQS